MPPLCIHERSRVPYGHSHTLNNVQHMNMHSCKAITAPLCQSHPLTFLSLLIEFRLSIPQIRPPPLQNFYIYPSTLLPPAPHDHVLTAVTAPSAVFRADSLTLDIVSSLTLNLLRKSSIRLMNRKSTTTLSWPSSADTLKSCLVMSSAPEGVFVALGYTTT